MKKLVDYRIDFPDGKSLIDEIDSNSHGWVLLDRACRFAEILERELFGLTYFADLFKIWLRDDKPISKQLKGHHYHFTFAVKYYVPHPLVIKDEIARHYFFLQIRGDILKNRLPCSFVSMALLSSYIIQSEVGDYQEEMNGSSGLAAIPSIKLCSAPTKELLEKIAELHKTHYGLPSVEAEMNFLENAKHLSLYGVHMYPVKGEQGVDMSIGICHSGILVYLDRLRVNRFVWARILTMSRDGNQFIINLRPSQGGSRRYKAVYKLMNQKEAKHLWKLAVDHHLLFRMKEDYHAQESPFQPFSLHGSFVRSFDEEEPMVGFTLPRVRSKSPEKQSTLLRQKVVELPLIVPLKSTERTEAHVEESVKNYTLDVLRFPGRSHSVDVDGMTYRPRQTLSQEQQAQQPHPNRHFETRSFLGGHEPPDHKEGATYEPCERYLVRSKYLPTVGAGHSDCNDYGEHVKYGYDVERESHSEHNLLLSGGFSHCQHKDLTLHESPKMIFQDQCHYTCSCDQIWQGRKNTKEWNDGNFQKEKRKTYMTSNGTQVTEYQVEKENVIETYIEKRHQDATKNNDQDATKNNDHDDMLLSEAIKETTGVDNNLRVERIELTTDFKEF